jgi:hypothetical protein
MDSPQPPVALAALSTKAAASFVAFGSVGAAGARTAVLAPALWGRERRGRRRVGVAALVGFAAMGAVLVALALAGVDHLPDWAKVPPAIVSVQTVYGMVVAVLVSDSYEPSIELSPGDLAFTLYGVIAFPAVALFVLVMAADSLLS